MRARLRLTMVVVLALSGCSSGHHGNSVTITTANNKKVVAPVSAVNRAGGVGAERGLSGDGNAKTQTSSDKANPDGPVVNGPIPLASPFQAGCLTRSNTANYSYRNGTKPSIIPLHLTVSANLPGWADVNGVDVFLDRPSTMASANYIVDGEGHCILAVAESLKAWAQVSFNSASACAIEVINTGNESVYIGSAGLHQLVRVVHDCAHRWHIPLQRAVVSGGTVLRAGVIDHYHLGAAGGGHFDIHNFGTGCRNQGSAANTWACVDLVIRAARALDHPVKPISRKARSHCTELNGIRRRTVDYHKKYHLKPVNPISRQDGRRAKYLRRYMNRNKLACKVGKPHRPGTLTRR